MLLSEEEYEDEDALKKTKYIFWILYLQPLAYPIPRYAVRNKNNLEILTQLQVDE